MQYLQSQTDRVGIILRSTDSTKRVATAAAAAAHTFSPSAAKQKEQEREPSAPYQCSDLLGKKVTGTVVRKALLLITTVLVVGDWCTELLVFFDTDGEDISTVLPE